MRPGILFLFLTILSFEISAQAFQKKDYHFSLMISPGGYERATHLIDKNVISSITMVGLPMGLEYNLLNEIGIGIMYRPNWISNKDSVAGKGTLQNLYFSNILHLLNGKNADLSFALHYGPGFHSYKSNANNIKTLVKAVGFNYVAGLRGTFFSGNFAVIIGASYANYPLTITTWEENGANRLDRSGGNNYNINYTGLEISFGIMYRLHRVRD